MSGFRKAIAHEMSSSDSEIDDILIKDLSKSKQSSVSVSTKATSVLTAKTDSDALPTLHRKRAAIGKGVPSHYLSERSDSEEDPGSAVIPLKSRRVDPDIGKIKEDMKYQKQLEREQKKREKEEEKLRKQQEKLQKQKEKEEKRKEVELDKQNKRIAMATKRSAKPGECLKLICATISPGVLKLSSGGAILAELQKNEIRYDITSQCNDHMISVWREVTKPDSMGKFVTSERVEDNVLLMLDVNTFISLVDAINTKKNSEPSFVDIEDIESYVRRLKNTLEDRKITIIVQGIEKHFRNQANKQKRAFKSQVNNEPEKVRRKKQDGTSDSTVTRLDVESALVQLQLSTDCSIRFVENDQDAAKLVFGFVKAIAEIPFKRDRFVSGFSFHIESGGAIQVDKDGVGLSRVWRQQLQQFKNVSAEVANTIIAVYSSPQALRQAYSRCSTEKEAQLLLQDLEVRRGAGVMTTSRRVGKEMSRRLHALITSRDPTQVLP